MDQQEHAGATLQKITPNLRFKGNAEEAVNFYLTACDDARMVRVARYGKVGALPEGTRARDHARGSGACRSPMAAMMRMKKIDIKTLQEAGAG